MQYYGRMGVLYISKINSYDDERSIANSHCFSTKRVFRVRFHTRHIEFLQGEEHLRHTQPTKGAQNSGAPTRWLGVRSCHNLVDNSSSWRDECWLYRVENTSEPVEHCVLGQLIARLCHGRY